MRLLRRYNTKRNILGQKKEKKKQLKKIENFKTNKRLLSPSHPRNTHEKNLSSNDAIGGH